MSETQKAPDAKSGSSVVWFALLAVLCCGGAMIKGCGDDSTGSTGGALIACKDYVKDRLKSPGTADFSGLSLDESAGRVTVAGTVDSQNSFGGTVRNTFTCVVSGSGDSWSLVSIAGLTN